MYEAITTGKEYEFKKMIEDLKRVSKDLTLTELVDKILDVTGIRKEYENENSLDAEIRLENLEEFKSITKSYEEEYGVISLSDFLNEISLVSDVSEHQDGNNKVNLILILLQLHLFKQSAVLMIVNSHSDFDCFLFLAAACAVSIIIDAAFDVWYSTDSIDIEIAASCEFWSYAVMAVRSCAVSCATLYADYISYFDILPCFYSYF